MGDPFAEVMGPLGALRDRISEELAGRGLQLVHFAVAPGPSLEGPHEMQFIATLRGPDEPKTDDGEFNDVIRGAHAADVEGKATAALDELRSRLQGGDDFLGTGDG